ncbi:hypothetical protein [Silvanigrella sp.]|jgi:hypothetical protein|uniref:hypothetical protein n=1 Tax=Silvanigrella sp. TaxID=2024976 RepID=UPI0037CC78AE|nr:hypothetical protein [Silvanigrellaceae bacterium]
MKEHNHYDFHSVYLKSQSRGSENWARIEGVQDAEARFSQNSLKNSLNKKKLNHKILTRVTKTTSIIPGAVRQIIRFFK